MGYMTLLGAGPPGGAGFSPLSLAPLIWLKDTGYFQDSAGTTPANNGDVVGRWTDQSGNGNHVTQAGAAGVKPLRIDSGQNSRTVVRWDGTDDVLTSAAVNWTEPLTIFLAAKRTLEANAVPFDISNGSSPFAQCYDMTGPNRNIMFRTGNGPTSTEWTDGTFAIVECRFESASSILKVNNNADNTGDPGTSGTVSRALSLGLGNGGAIYLAMDVGEFIAYSGVNLTSGNRTSIRTYLNTRWAAF